jgi:peptidoglycan/xylan/chitin deacetylase (PgdA/CDA1 family)
MRDWKRKRVSGRGLLVTVAALAGLVCSRVEAASQPSRPLWPEGKICAVTISFDVDGETVWWEDPATQQAPPGSVSHGRYGPQRALPKILELLERHRLRATFFVPSWIAETYPEPIKAIAAAGHELGAHGARHESPSTLDRDEELRVLRDSRALLQRVTGASVVGYRAPSWALSESTLDLVAKEGFLYSSNLMDSDLPYVHGDPRGLVELPVSWVLDDAAHFWFDEDSWDKPIVSAASVAAIWKEEFEAAYEEGGYFNLTLHPQFIGRPTRLKMLDRFLSWTKGFPAVWFATAEEVAVRVKERAGQPSGRGRSKATE